MLVGDLLLARRMFWISITCAEPSEKDGDRDSDLSAGSEDCTAPLTKIADGLGDPTAMPAETLLGLEMAFPCVRKKAMIQRLQGAVDYLIHIFPFAMSEGNMMWQRALSRPCHPVLMAHALTRSAGLPCLRGPRPQSSTLGSVLDLSGCSVISRDRGWGAHEVAQGGHAGAGGCAGWPLGARQQVLVRVQVLQGVL